MAHSLSAKKRIRQNARRSTRNKKPMTQIKNLARKHRETPTDTSLKSFQIAVTKAWKFGSIKKNKAARLLSRAARLIKKS